MFCLLTTSSSVQATNEGLQASRDPPHSAFTEVTGVTSEPPPPTQNLHTGSHQGLSASALLASGAGGFFVGGSPVSCMVFSNVPDLCSLDASGSPPQEM